VKPNTSLCPANISQEGRFKGIHTLTKDGTIFSSSVDHSTLLLSFKMQAGVRVECVEMTIGPVCKKYLKIY